MNDALPPDAQREARDAADQTRVVQAAERWKVRSRRVRFMRRALPITIAVLAGLTALWIGARSVISGLEARAVRTSEIRLSNPMFHGQDGQGRSFVIGAEQAVRSPRDQSFRLDGPLFRLDLSAGRVTEIRAGEGIYDERSRQLVMRDQVRITDGGAGFDFTTDEARIDTRSGHITGERGITGQGPVGTLEASSYEITDEGRRVIFRGSGDDKVRATLNTTRQRR